ncbi:MAG: hypothetical protein Tsb0034_14570 [Ekhidna sp.]
MLHQLKYNGKKELAYLIGTWFAPGFSEIEFDMVIPVPLHKSKQRKRGYNQSEFFGRGFADSLNVPLHHDIITRIKATDTQTRKSKVERWGNLVNIYSSVATNLDGKRVLVVDDVVTTGATIGMLCERLVEANVSEIHIAAIARGK